MSNMVAWLNTNSYLPPAGSLNDKPLPELLQQADLLVVDLFEIRQVGIDLQKKIGWNIYFMKILELT